MTASEEPRLSTPTERALYRDCKHYKTELAERDREVERLKALLAAGVASWERCDEIIRASGYEGLDREDALRALVAARQRS